MANKIKLAGTTANAFQIGLQGVTLNAAPATSAYQLNLPANVGSSNQYLKTDGTGNLSWATVSGGSGTPGGANTQIQFNDDSAFGGSAAFTFDKTTNAITATGNITASYFSGNGALLSSIVGANVTGTVANATYATSAGSATTATSAITAGTVTTNAQPNITSIGTLTTLSITGIANLGSVSNVKIIGGLNTQVLTTDGTGNLTWTTPTSGGGGESLSPFLLMGA